MTHWQHAAAALCLLAAALALSASARLGLGALRGFVSSANHLLAGQFANSGCLLHCGSENHWLMGGGKSNVAVFLRQLSVVLDAHPGAAKGLILLAGIKNCHFSTSCRFKTA
ncbi:MULTISPECIES: hypothetical protein [Aquitalea]|uniref:hypothetical protein n=1 Tax=Aquitalea TaxID=407217 RepID=UPI000F5B5071|nr:MULTISPECIES: hypothetical protein [Aquitalea]